jgi:hypothetical protein
MSMMLATSGAPCNPFTFNILKLHCVGHWLVLDLPINILQYQQLTQFMLCGDSAQHKPCVSALGAKTWQLPNHADAISSKTVD